MSNDSIQVILLFYVGTLMVNILIAIIQWLDHKGPVQKYLLWYWITLIVSAVANSFPLTDHLSIGMISGVGTFLSQWILGSVLISSTLLNLDAQPTSEKPIAQSFNLLAKLPLSQFSKMSLLLWNLNAAFEVFGFFLVLGAAAPFFIAVYMTYKNRQQKYSLIQKSFIAIGILMSLHYLDWSYFRPRPELFATGLLIAFALLHMMSILCPALANEHSLLIRTEKLESEIQMRAEQIKTKELQLAASNKMASIGRMAGGVSHEINTPLAIISMYTENLLSYKNTSEVPPEEFKESLQKILNTTDRISKITSALRKVSRDQISTERVKANLNQLIQESLSFFHQRLIDSGIQLELNLPTYVVECFCNPVEISQILINLLNNSVDALQGLSANDLPQTTHKNISLHLKQTLKNGENFAQIKIVDSGHIDPDVAEKIMDPFYTTKPIGAGTGLGLSISLSIAKAHGGVLYLDTKAPNTCFILEIPLEQKLITNELYRLAGA